MQQTIPPRQFGYEAGDTCKRQFCKGVIDLHPVEDCSCHLHPPCSACTSPRAFCPTCGWEESEDQQVNGFVGSTNKKTGIQSWERRALDTSRIDWHDLEHTHFSRIREGVCPEGTTAAQVLELVKGTFGGRFEHFGNGRFKYIAYTD